MIICGDDRVVIKGDTAGVLAEFTQIIKSMREMLAEEMGEEMADEHIVECGKVAYMTSEELEEYNKQLMEELREKLRGMV